MCIVGRGGASWLGQINFIFFNFEFELVFCACTSRHVSPRATTQRLVACTGELQPSFRRACVQLQQWRWLLVMQCSKDGCFWQPSLPGIVACTMGRGKP